ncbi:YggS family pyridoxal phosphate-dependent enzyme [Gloeocapsa sp. PCC 73106]|uniref:YggS family pyridoxal phosphate-dependent enzyme n=1 Tax=Gloeocapsa sp. PCC 73106 TaxID=102232 RepID=UPI0002AC949F|nr:YggS family pyridoxal phosphate-dependent enzyme [Gloeocapsa sp. PCC 73106]ELR97978.1 pyridoxal phosphate enzyme, YggS family [Gloeocapsa sp. PCC 73106]
MSLIIQKIEQLRQEIPPNVRLIGITKGVEVEAIAQAYDAGLRDFGESRLQEAIPKQEQLKSYQDITWHFIGHLQSRKAKKVVESFPWIHSVDSLKLAERLDDCARELSVSPRVCLQVKLVPDPNKYGWHSQELIQDLATLNQYQHLNIQGLMTILPLGLSPTEALTVFKSTRELAQQINQQNWSNLRLSELSMGMSGDYLLGIQAGATMIRLGRAIFL